MFLAVEKLNLGSETVSIENIILYDNYLRVSEFIRAFLLLFKKRKQTKTQEPSVVTLWDIILSLSREFEAVAARFESFGESFFNYNIIKRTKRGWRKRA